MKCWLIWRAQEPHRQAGYASSPANPESHEDGMKLRMFGNRILDFARSIDIMDQETFNDVIELIAWYVKDHLDVAIFAVLGEIRVDAKRWFEDATQHAGSAGAALLHGRQRDGVRFAQRVELRREYTDLVREHVESAAQKRCRRQRSVVGPE
jgi:hypothetical protein